MAVIGIGMTIKARRATRVQTTFVAETCTMFQSYETGGKGKKQEHHVVFGRTVNGVVYRSTQYSPDVEYGPGAQWFPEGASVTCYCDPQDPGTMYLEKGAEMDRESFPWMIGVAFPALFIGIGLAMRFSKREME
jgi:hypothetical protein